MLEGTPDYSDEILRRAARYVSVIGIHTLYIQINGETRKFFAWGKLFFSPFPLHRKHKHIALVDNNILVEYISDVYTHGYGVRSVIPCYTNCTSTCTHIHTSGEGTKYYYSSELMIKDLGDEVSSREFPSGLGL